MAYYDWLTGAHWQVQKKVTLLDWKHHVFSPTFVRSPLTVTRDQEIRDPGMDIHNPVHKPPQANQ